MGKLVFPLKDSDSFCEALLEYLNANIDELHSVLNFSQQDANERVEIDDVSIRRVTIRDDGSLDIEYEYSWSFYAGCKDINDAGLEVESVSARLVGGVIEFDEIEHPEPRSTLEEF